MFDDSDSPSEPGRPAPAGSEIPAPSASESPTPTEETLEPSPAQARFKACRWHADKDGQEYCSKRDVLPYAGKGGFAPEAWCPDCSLYKLRRTPKKRPRPDDNDDYLY